MFRVCKPRRAAACLKYSTLTLCLTLCTTIFVSVELNGTGDLVGFFSGNSVKSKSAANAQANPFASSVHDPSAGGLQGPVGIAKELKENKDDIEPSHGNLNTNLDNNIDDAGNVSEDNAVLTRTARSFGSNSVVQAKKIVTQGGADPDPDVNMKREFVKKMMADSWRNYKLYAWGTNELAPISRKGRNGGEIFGNTNMGATIIDALSTLHIMGFDEEFELARNWTATEFHFKDVCGGVSVFETTIRFLGGLLSAYALSKDSVFVEKAIEVADSLMPAFETPHGIPYGWVTPCRQKANSFGISLAELGSLHLEFTYLSALTRKRVYAEKVQKIRQRLQQILPPDGLYKNQVTVSTGTFSTQTASIGAGADSFYEYLMKSWIQTGDRKARKMYDGAIEAMNRAGMFRVSSPSHLMYIGTRNWNENVDESFSHLACFAGGMLALGAVTDPKPQERTLDGLSAGANITNTCHESYIRSATRIGPEEFSMRSRYEARSDESMSSYYILRPEVIESYFYLYRLTKDPKYRDWAWDAAQAIHEHCHVGASGGYSGIRSVYTVPTQKDDVQQSFYLAETLKYLYLIFSSDNLINLDYWVFNTEAHPLPIRGQNPMFPTRPRKKFRHLSTPAPA